MSEVNQSIIPDNVSIKSLRQNGFTTVTNIFRPVKTKFALNIGGKILYFDSHVDIPNFEIKRKKLQNSILPKGGYVTVKIVDPSGKTVTGESICSHHDIFVKKIGVAGAVIDAWKQYLKV